MVRARLVVSGNIQGVGYRALVKLVARNLNIKGHVKNLEDGAVEIFCETDEQKLAQFKKMIDRKADHGDIYAINVTKMEQYHEGDKNYINPPMEFRLFDIDYGMEIDSVHKEPIERLEIGTLVMLKGFGDVKEGLKEVGSKVDNVAEKVDGVGKKVDRVGEKVDGVGAKVDNLTTHTDEHFNKLDEKYGIISETLVSMNTEQTRTRVELTRAVDNLNSLVNSVNTLIKEHIEKDKEK